MEKRLVNKRDYNFLVEEINYFKNAGVVSGEQAEELVDLYSIKPGVGFVKTVLTIGAVLVGLGILSFIASNWQGLSKLVKYLVIISSFVGANYASYKLIGSYPKTSRGLLYLGSIIFGAGIFLIGQMFNFGGHYTNAMLLWSLGVFPAAILFRDQILYIFTIILTMFYLNGYWGQDGYPWAVVVAIPLFYYCNRYLGGSKFILFINNVLLLNAIGYLMYIGNIEAPYSVMTYFVVGLILCHLPSNSNKFIYELQGNILFGVSGLILTFAEVWRNSINGAEVTSLIFSVVYVLYLLLQTKKENILALIFICVTVFRFYVDLTYDFMPKSMVFISSGLLLLAFGYYIERFRKKKEGVAR